MALLDCAINKKCCTVDGGRGICPLFSSPPRGICQLKSPHPREFAIQGKKNANSRGSARGGLGTGGIDWCIITVRKEGDWGRGTYGWMVQRTGWLNSIFSLFSPVWARRCFRCCLTPNEASGQLSRKVVVYASRSSTLPPLPCKRICHTQAT